MPSNLDSETHPKDKPDLLLPNLDQEACAPSLGQPLPTNLNYPPAAFPTNLNYPPAAFPGNLNLSLPATFPIPPAQMQPYFDYDSQPLWAGNGVPNFDPFLPMPPFGDHIAIPPAGSLFAFHGFHPEGAIVNHFAADPSTQVPAAPFDTFGSNQVNFAMDSMQMPAEPVDKGEDKTSSIPLICLLCPKRPKFSDKSHLLTHISSKSHLAAQFKLQHSGKSEDKHTLDQYKLWSDTNGVDKLVANRIAAKELKKPAKKQRLAAVEASNKAGKNIKLEADDSFGAHLENAPLHANPNIWHLHAPRDNSFETLYGTPSYNDHSFYPLPDSPQGSAYIKNETSQSSTETANTSFLAEAADVGDGGDASKLKGTIYPGMGLFDAATPLQKRKRNQKKHASVVRNMEMTSASIGQDEEVWDITMSEVTRTRNVYDSPSIDGSPDSKEEPPSTTKKRRSRQPAVPTASTGPRRQTRAVTRAANNAKVVKRRSARQAKKLIKVEDELDSEDDPAHRLDDEVEEGNAVTGDDVFQEHRQIRQDAPGPARGNRFDLSFRNAMNNLPSNTPLMAPSSFFSRPSQSFFPGFGMKENDNMAFPMHQAGTMHGYFPQNRQNMQASASGFNPLYLQRQDNYPFLYGGHSFEASKPPTPAFQTLNSTDFAGMDSTPSFQPGQAQQDDFEV